MRTNRELSNLSIVNYIESNEEYRKLFQEFAAEEGMELRAFIMKDLAEIDDEQDRLELNRKLLQYWFNVS